MDRSAATTTRSRTPSPVAQMDSFIARLSPPMAKLTKVVVKKMRQRLPGAVELVYDKRNSLVIGFCPDQRASSVARIRPSTARESDESSSSR